MHYTDTKQTVVAGRDIPISFIDRATPEERARFLEYIKRELMINLRFNAEEAAITIGWSRYLFVEQLPYRWPDMSEKEIERKRFELHSIYERGPGFTVQASANLYERLPDWRVHEMTTPLEVHHLKHLARPVATDAALGWTSGLAVAVPDFETATSSQATGVIYFWPKSAPEQSALETMTAADAIRRGAITRSQFDQAVHILRETTSDAGVVRIPVSVAPTYYHRSNLTILPVSFLGLRFSRVETGEWCTDPEMVYIQ